MIKDLTTENFATEIQNADKPVLVDFWAPWCGYCKRLAPLLNSLAGSYENEFIVGKVNVDDAPEISEKYGIMTLPTLLVFKNGEYGEPLIAPDSKTKITDWLKTQGVL